ncbi:helix-turn-helix transcriptional regulator [Caballeronia sp. LZ065]|uniref:helix-turn-helix domain-containing protein n=1 Tax=Caballeronia sp. LZ065 TaxID=3038571 RepID=UPI00285EDD37|nr:helix-turn-helix transcriptional regulator [Caballeronia sp. LZ065]MDR5778128.1 helix-turn-helix transcriptional regulator [Caballeronia sp. LZ065]
MEKGKVARREKQDLELPKAVLSVKPRASQDAWRALADAIAEARGSAGLTQEEVALRMRTTQSNIARLEAGRTIPSTRTLKKFADAVGARLKITFERSGR